MFQSILLDEAFQRDLDAKRKVIPRLPRPANTCPPFENATSSNRTPPTTNRNQKCATWHTFHKTNYHSFKDCRVLKARSPKTSFFEATPSMHNAYGEVTKLTKPT